MNANRPHPQYPTLLSPLDVGPFSLRNRVIMGSMHVGLEEQVGPLTKLAAYARARAEGGVGLIVTGGFSPNREGWLKPLGGTMMNRWDAFKHRVVTDAVHDAGGRIALQILHAGRYGYHPLQVAPSARKSPITPFSPRALSERGVLRTIRDFANSAKFAKQAGYDGVEIMGSEGYLINQFLVTRTNARRDRWGGSYENRMRFPVEVLKAVRDAVGSDFLVIYRLSMLDLVDEGSTFDEVVELAGRVQEAGVNVINTGIGWHEARVPTIATMVPRAGFAWVTRRLRPHIQVPLVTSNRINMPDIAESVLADGTADLVSMARPFLADPDWVAKAEADRADDINTCIACNQACLDHIFVNQHASCLVNPLAGRETELKIHPTRQRRRVAVVGAGPAGLAAACTAAERGHDVVLFEASERIGGQFNLAKQIPGKEEFHETLRYFRRRLDQAGVDVRLATRAGASELSAFDAVLVATGVTPRALSLPGIDHPSVVSYIQVLRGEVEVGARVAIVGAGGIGHDVATFLAERRPSTAEDPAHYAAAWGIAVDSWGASPDAPRGGLVPREDPQPARTITMCQRSGGKMGAGLGKTTGWIHRASLDHLGVTKLTGVAYVRVDDAGLHVTVDGAPRVIPADHVVLCAGQVSDDRLVAPLRAAGVEVHAIGGAHEAGDLDAKRAIEQGTRVAAAL